MLAKRHLQRNPYWERPINQNFIEINSFVNRVFFCSIQEDEVYVQSLIMNPSASGILQPAKYVIIYTESIVLKCPKFKLFKKFPTYPNDSWIGTYQKVNRLRTNVLKSELPNLWFTFKNICILNIYLFHIAFKVNHIVDGPKRGRPSHISPVQSFWFTLNVICP